MTRLTAAISKVCLSLRRQTGAGRLATAVLVATFAAATAGAQAQAPDTANTAEEAPRRYSLEVILFAYDESVSAGTEVFRPDPPPASDLLLDADGEAEIPEFGDGTGYEADGDNGGPIPDRDDSIGRDDIDAEDDASGDVVPAMDVDIRMTPPDELALEEIHRKLTQLDAYEPVLWGGWTQFLPEETQSTPMNLHRIGELPGDFDGSLTLYVGRFVHLTVDIARAATAAASGDSTVAPTAGGFDRERRRFGYEPPPAPIRYRIQEDRIMRNGDLRYFDHPRFGLIAELRLLEPPDPAGIPADDDSGDLLPPEPAGNASGSAGQ